MTDRLTTPAMIQEEVEYDISLRPTRFEDFIGQNKTVDNLKVFIEAARQRGEPLDHALFYGPPGLGKTTLAFIIASELGVKIKATSGPVLEKAADLAGILTNLDERDVIFIDEIHRINKVVEEYLYSAMEDFTLDIMIDKGPAARSVKLPLKPFTLIGATTRAGLLTSPMRARFGVVGRLDYYDAEDLGSIVRRSARLLEVGLDDGGCEQIARRSRGTPRIANRLLRRVRDFAQVRGNGRITETLANESLVSLDVDELGLDEMDKKILTVLIEKFSGGPVGLNSLAVAVGEDAETLEEIYEPFLIQEGLLDRTPRGRVATDTAYRHFNFESKSSEQGRLL